MLCSYYHKTFASYSHSGSWHPLPASMLGNSEPAAGGSCPNELDTRRLILAHKHNQAHTGTENRLITTCDPIVTGRTAQVGFVTHLGTPYEIEEVCEHSWEPTSMNINMPTDPCTRENTHLAHVFENCVPEGGVVFGRACFLFFFFCFYWV